MTSDGTMILDPQPDDSANDPLNWPSWRRDAALLTLGFYCMVGGGMTPLIAAGFDDVAHDMHVEHEEVALTTGLYMMGLGLGSVLFSPTAILWGKRPVYLASSILFVATSLWAGWSDSFGSLIAARVLQGVAVSPVECLPSATIAEIFFLHERAYRIGIYTLLLLGGKNLVPLVSAAVIESLSWRWTFWVVAIIVGFCGVTLYFFVPETFWDRTPTRKPKKRPSFLRRLSSRHGGHTPRSGMHTPRSPAPPHLADTTRPSSPGIDGRHDHAEMHVGGAATPAGGHHIGWADQAEAEKQSASGPSGQPHNDHVVVTPPAAAAVFDSSSGYGSSSNVASSGPGFDPEKLTPADFQGLPRSRAYTHNLRQQPPQSFVQQLKLYNGRLNSDNWFKVALRPFVLYAYPAVLWSALVYACSIGWLIVISEALTQIYRSPDTYNFSALSAGLVYISPFVGGILGTAVAGRISDVIVKAMARRNGGLYEPEFRLVMAIPILFTTCIGLMGFGWSAENGDHWMAPTIFFGVVSFGCSLGSTTSITFCVDSYRQYAGEALVTLNFAKNIFHGLVFSLFVTHWLTGDGPKIVFIWIGVIQLVVMLTTIPMYIYGKRMRMWTARRNLMEKL